MHRYEKVLKVDAECKTLTQSEKSDLPFTFDRLTFSTNLSIKVREHEGQSPSSYSVEQVSGTFGTQVALKM